MPLELYARSGNWWIKGRIDEIPSGRYYRQSLGAPATLPEREANKRLAAFEQKEIKRHLLGDEAVLTFSDAVLLYDASPADAGFLKHIMGELKSETPLRDITPGAIRALGAKLYPKASTDTWQRQVVAPLRAVINNAHDLGKCPPIRVRGYTKAERLEQDRVRGKDSRQPKTPGSWEWINAFRTKADPRLGALALFMFTTGARITQSILINDGDDLDLQNGRVFLPEAKGHEAQWIDVMPSVVADLANLRARDGRIFGYQHRWSVYKPWKKACTDAKVEYIPPHAAGRHGFGTELIVRQGVDPVTVAQAGRWSTPVVPLKTYAHGEDSTVKVHAAFGTKPVQPLSKDPVKVLKTKRKA